MNIGLPTEIRFGWTRGTGPISKVIAWVTTPFRRLFKIKETPSHMVVVVCGENGCVYGEAHYDTDWRFGMPFSELVAWRDAKPGRRLWLSDPLPLEQEEVEIIYRMSQDRTKGWEYSKYQIWRMWLWRRFKIPVKEKDERGVVCSESASLFVWPFYDLPGILDVPGHNYVTPENSKRKLIGDAPEFIGVK